MNDVSIRPWYRLHWLTWFVMLGECVSLYHCQIPDRPAGFWNSLDDYERVYFGWPLAWMHADQSGSVMGLPASQRIYGFDGDISLLGINAAVGLLLVISCGLVVELWMRRSRRLQFTIKDLLTLVAAVSILLNTLSRLLYLVDAGVFLLLLLACLLVVETWKRKDRWIRVGVKSLPAVALTVVLLLTILLCGRSIESSFESYIDLHALRFHFPRGVGWPSIAVVTVGVGCAIFLTGSLTVTTLRKLAVLAAAVTKQNSRVDTDAAEALPARNR